MLGSMTVPQHRHRLFFALFPPPLVARRIAHWAEARFGPSGDYVRAARLHVTLDILEDFETFPKDIAERLVEAGHAVAADPFMIELDQVSAGGGRIALRPRLKNASLQRLAYAIAAARSETGIPVRPRYRFNPHMTLLYREGTPFSQMVTPFAWPVQQFVLVHSLLGRTRHEPIASWELTGKHEDLYLLL